jgi:two-component system, NarL family, nitrate/nitrite response regulator NarL
VLRLAAEGCSGPEIAARLIVSPSTIKTHFENIGEKLGVSDRAGAVARAMRIGLVHRPGAARGCQDAARWPRR